MELEICDSFSIKGMYCVSCEGRITGMLKKTDGVLSAKADWKNGTVEVQWDAGKISRKEIIKIIEKLDYQVVREGTPSTNSHRAIIASFIIILALYLMLRSLGVLNLFNIFPHAEENLAYSMLFLIGLLTSLHCIGMCGGINLSQSLPTEGTRSFKPGFLYNAGRVISYTLIGAIVGALGSVISFSPAAKGFVQLAAGVFMIIMGVNMLGLFPALRRFNLHLPKSLSDRLSAGLKGKGPLYIGLLNGLMPCGPLQAMQLYALSTASPLKGAVAMFLFSLGTVPAMLGLSSLASGLGAKYRTKVLAAGSVLVVVMGFGMLLNGVSLAGVKLPSLGAPKLFTVQEVYEESDIQTITTRLSPYRYEPIVVEAGKPVRWIIEAERGTVNGCNNRINIPEYGIQKPLALGKNVVEFIPSRTGTFLYSCWMGMIRSTITVVEPS